MIKEWRGVCYGEGTLNIRCYIHRNSRAATKNTETKNVGNVRVTLQCGAMGYLRLGVISDRRTVYSTGSHFCRYSQLCTQYRVLLLLLGSVVMLLVRNYSYVRLDLIYVAFIKHTYSKFFSISFFVTPDL